MPYNHREKAGNLGDVFKHPLLICCLETILKQHDNQKPFVYVDLFSAYPYVELTCDEQQWKQGVKKFFDEQGNPRTTNNPHIKYWIELTTLPKNGKTGHYSGSIEIAHKILKLSGLEYIIYANDSGNNEFNQLDAYASDTNNEAGKKRIIVTQKKAQCINLSEPNPDFVFIDPPNISENTGYTSDNYENHLRQIKTAQFLTWVPAFPEDEEKIRSLQEVNKGAKRISVRWAKNGFKQKSIGCHLFYRLPEKTEEQIKETSKALKEHLGLNE